MGLEFLIVASGKDFLENDPKVWDPGIGNFVADLEAKTNGGVLKVGTGGSLSKVIGPRGDDLHP